ncbi:hypothetical protein LK540_11270 [Massilia sp. IC2-278]|uniref:hypothetical protein n=1 Tax=Massilia sp. IC2-278 TaxID=2887200 RepID=UPI001E50508A|nr:hypothetical protein [Massilia sp. IC2-278]MCC2961003.1 hypothetical protein [Massilia sp. IC2-278]
MTWTEAEASSTSQVWEDATLEFSNSLTGHLHANAYADYQQWNSIVDKAKHEVILPLEHDVWRPMVRRRGWDEKIVATLQWDILGALMENAFCDIQGCPDFFQRLLTTYEAGHFPCGWEGTIEPLAGRIIVY